MMRVLSREPERSMLGFSREVAREVTQPLWPSRVPLRMSCSVMLMEVVGVAVELLSSSVQIIEINFLPASVGLFFSVSLRQPGNCAKDEGRWKGKSKQQR